VAAGRLCHHSKIVFFVIFFRKWSFLTNQESGLFLSKIRSSEDDLAVEERSRESRAIKAELPGATPCAPQITRQGGQNFQSSDTPRRQATVESIAS
jgi:hypothetical protein